MISEPHTFSHCRQNCEDKIDAFLRRTYYVDGGYDNRKGMSKLTGQMEQVEVSVSILIQLL